MTPQLPSFLALDVPPALPDKARFEIIPVPLEHSVSYGRGTAAGPASLLEASLQLEAYDGEGVPAYAGIYTGPAVDCVVETVEVLLQVERRVAAALAGGRVPVVLGGEHTVTLGAVRAFAAGGKPFGVVQFDAHADLRDQYEENPFSHACVMRRIIDLGVPVFQVGVRSLSVAEAVFRQDHAIAGWDAATLAQVNPSPLALPPDFPAQIYLTFDVDAFDPAVMPGTGTPEPGGLFWHEALRLIEGVLTGRRLVGFDVTELAPVPGSHISEFTAAKLVYRLMAVALRTD
ncbi:MAG: agmatinase [Kiritimatiellia bacterium]